MTGPRSGWPLALALLLLGQPHLRGDEPGPAAADEKIVTAAGLKTDGAALLEFFRQRTLTPQQKLEVEAEVQRLGADSFRLREQATAKLIGRGPVILELLAGCLDDPPDLEFQMRVRKCIKDIQDRDLPPQVPAAAARLLRDRKPAGAARVLLDYLPFANNDAVVEEVRGTLAALAAGDPADQALLAAALKDRRPAVRAAAGESLARADLAGYRDDVRALLQDKDPSVRFRVAEALVYEKDAEAVPAVIELLPQLPQAQAWQAEDLLIRVAGDRPGPDVSLGQKKADREKCRDAWAAWWKGNAGKVDLAGLSRRPRLLGHTLLVLLDENKVMELGADDRVRWSVDNLNFPLDAEVLPDDRLLVAEYHASRVTERNFKGEVLWQKLVPGPLVAQRVKGGNTFIGTDSQLLEVNPDGNVVWAYTSQNGERFLKSAKLPNGDVLCLTTMKEVVWIDGRTREVQKSFDITLAKDLFGGRLYTTPTGRVLVPHCDENKVVEYDAEGKSVWEVKIEQPVAATRLPNGNTLVTTMTQNRAVEFDRAGNEVWEYESGTSRVTRALRR